MPFLNGESAGDPDSAQELLDLLLGELDSHLAWELEATVSGVQFWKNRGAVNGWGRDFFVAIQKVSTTSIRFWAMEEFDSVTGEHKYPCFNSSSTVQYTLDANAGLAGPFALSDSLFGIPGGSRMGSFTVTTDPNGYLYALQVTNTTLMLVARVGLTSGVFTGLFEPFSDDTDKNFPLFITDIVSTLSSNSSPTYTSRHPGRQNTAHTSNCRGNGFSNLPNGTNNQWTRFDGTPGGTDYDVIIGRPSGTRRTIVTNGGGNTNFGISFGLYPHCLAFNPPAGVTLNDTLDVNGEAFVNIFTYTWFNTEAV